jgi:hypothetical protein
MQRRRGSAGERSFARTGVIATTAVVTLGLIAGGVVATGLMLRPAAPVESGPYPVGQPVRTRVGIVQVTGVDRLSGLSAQDLSNANHGVANLVAPDQAQVQVTLRLTNDGRRAVSYSASQVGLRVGGGAPIKAMSSTLPQSRLGAGVSLEGTLGFVAPRTGSALQLELPGPDGPVLVDLGRTDTGAVQPGSGGHH